MHVLASNPTCMRIYTTPVYVYSYRIAGYGRRFSFFNFSWVDILALGAILHRICIVEEN